MDSNSSGLVYIVEDSEEVGYWLQRCLQRHGHEVVVTSSAEDFLSLPEIRTPSTLLLDVHLPGATGLDLQARLIQSQLFLPIVFISGQSRNEEIIQAFRGGAIEFLWKPFTEEELLAAVHKAMSRSWQHAAQKDRFRLVRECSDRLSPREIEILPFVLKGYSNKQIAKLIDIQPDTAKKHRHSILDKCCVRDVAALIELFDVDHGDKGRTLSS